MIIKICGVTREADVETCARYGVDWIGFNLWPGSKRAVSATVAASLADHARKSGLTTVGLMVGPEQDELDRVWASGSYDLLQLYDCDGLSLGGVKYIRPIAVSAGTAIRLEPSDAMYDLIETAVQGYGGQGQAFAWDRLEAVETDRQFLVAGGITPDNVGDLLGICTPFGIDIASGVETEPGLKDEDKIRTLVERVRG